MTFVLTELSHVGIAMVADSAITKSSRGKIIEIDQKGWKKLLRVPSIKGAVSYWGMIGAVTRMRFDEWLQKIINAGGYNDLPSFADHLADALNDACHGKAMKDDQHMGLHVAGYSFWADGQARPTFYHVHNGHGQIEVHQEIDAQGKIIAVNPKWLADPRTLFQKHQDFPSNSMTPDENWMVLQRHPYTTRNGDYFIYSVISERLSHALHYINLIPGVSIPRDPESLRSRMGMLHTILETMVRLYRCSNQSQIIGGTVSSLAIGPNGYV